MKIAFLSNWVAVDYARWLSESLIDLGHSVWRYGPCTRNHLGVKWGEAERFMDLVQPLPHEVRLADFDCGLVIVNAWQELLLEADGRKCAFVLICTEGWPWAWDRKHQWKPDVCYTTQPYGVLAAPFSALHPDLSAIDRGWEYLPGACYPPAHPYLHMPRDFDFACLANSYGLRPVLCAYLRNEGFSVIEGQGTVVDYALTYNRALASCDSNEGQSFLKWRFYEGISMGCIQMWTRFNLLDQSGFVPDEHYIEIPARRASDGRIEPVYETVATELLNLKGNDARVRQLREAGMRKVLREDTMWHRAKQILADI